MDLLPTKMKTKMKTKTLIATIFLVLAAIVFISQIKKSIIKIEKPGVSPITPPLMSETKKSFSYEKLTIQGEVSPYGIYDPSIKFDPNGVGWLVYSGGLGPGQVETHLAKSLDQGKTWTFIKKLNSPREETLEIKGEDTLVVWRHETPTLIYDPQDPQKEWKLFYATGFSKPPHGRRNTYWEYVQIALRAAHTPEELASQEEIILFEPRGLPAPYKAKYDLNNLHPNKEFYFFMEPGATLKDGIIYLSLHGVTKLFGAKNEIFLVSSKDHGKTWEYQGTLLTTNDAKSLGYNLMTASDFAEIGERVLLLVSPKKNRNLFQAYYDGLYVFEVEDLTRAQLKRDKADNPIVYKYLPPLSSENIGGGQSDYDPGNLYGGVLMSQSDPRAPQERFTVFSTKEKL